MAKGRYTAPTGPGTLGLLRSTGPLIQKTRGSKDMDAKAELASAGRSRDFPQASEAVRALHAKYDAMPTEPNRPVPDEADDGKTPF
ncbi:MAG: hypothetical protein ACD_54C00177G0003 [uncultured bacterium]|nr:MAG: hypothetical protein ACD_54C00177G0003 [uncultured bacterium]